MNGVDVGKCEPEHFFRMPADLCIVLKALSHSHPHLFRETEEITQIETKKNSHCSENSKGERTFEEERNIKIQEVSSAALRNPKALGLDWEVEKVFLRVHNSDVIPQILEGPIQT